jgi:FkbM family methyltransferase
MSKPTCEKRPVFNESLGLWFPWTEARQQKMYDGLLKYRHDMDFMLSLLTKKARGRSCVQAGGHLGLWPLWLAPNFYAVHTFEPDPPVYDALRLNIMQAGNIDVTWGALGETNSYALLSWYSGRTGVSTMVQVKDEGDNHSEVPVYTIDSLDKEVSAIVLDIEGYEPWALRGARQTIQDYRPLILCEMLRKSAEAITETMREMDYFPVDNPRNRKCRDTLFAYGGKP